MSAPSDAACASRTPGGQHRDLACGSDRGGPPLRWLHSVPRDQSTSGRRLACVLRWAALMEPPLTATRTYMLTDTAAIADPEESAREAGLRYVRDDRPGIIRKGAGK